MERLLKEIQKKRINNECRTVTLMGHKNISMSDLDTIELYIETYLREGSVNGLMEQYGPVGEILKEAGIVFNSNW